MALIVPDTSKLHETALISVLMTGGWFEPKSSGTKRRSTNPELSGAGVFWPKSGRFHPEHRSPARV